MIEPLYPAAIHGIRCWRVVTDQRDGGLLLKAAGVGTAWRPGGVIDAACGARGDHLAPAPDCTCGIHAFHPWNGNALVNGLANGPSQVVGVISAWGRIEVHLDGFRAEHVRIEALYIYGEDEDERSVVTELAERYGAELIEVPDLTAARRHATRLPGISRQEAARLVTESLELVLEPETGSFIGNDGIPIARSGYRHESPGAIPGLFETPVAGVSFRPEALQLAGFAPGSDVELRPEPDNEHDRHAIAVVDPETGAKAGYVPRKLNRRVGNAIKRGQVKRTIVLGQHRNLETGERIGLELLLSPTERIHLLSNTEVDPNEEEICF